MRTRRGRGRKGRPTRPDNLASRPASGPAWTAGPAGPSTAKPAITFCTHLRWGKNEPKYILSILIRAACRGHRGCVKICALVAARILLGPHRPLLDACSLDLLALREQLSLDCCVSVFPPNLCIHRQRGRPEILKAPLGPRSHINQTEVVTIRRESPPAVNLYPCLPVEIVCVRPFIRTTWLPSRESRGIKLGSLPAPMANGPAGGALRGPVTRTAGGPGRRRTGRPSPGQPASMPASCAMPCRQSESTAAKAFLSSFFLGRSPEHRMNSPTQSRCPVAGQRQRSNYAPHAVTFAICTTTGSLRTTPTTRDFRARIFVRGFSCGEGGSTLLPLLLLLVPLVLIAILLELHKAIALGGPGSPRTKLLARKSLHESPPSPLLVYRPAD